MDDTTKKANGEYIWLRYTTQYPLGNRTQTIEIDVPVPIGASAETREQLLREAVAGMDQLAEHVESRIVQRAQRTQAAQVTERISEPRPAVATTGPAAPVAAEALQ